MKKYLTVHNLSCYERSFNLSNRVWNIVLKWDGFAKSTIGIQFVKAVDSQSANIAEGFGRFYKKDKVRFYNISFGSVMEALDWTRKALARKLISEKEYEEIVTELETLPKEIRHLIKFTNEKLAV